MAAVIPPYDHVVVVVEENHGFDEIIGNADATYINALARKGVLLTNYHAVSHPSQANYFALYAGDTFDVDNDTYAEPGPTLGSILDANGKSFAGYVEPDSPRKHNPWESFPEGISNEQDISAFPQTDFSALPSVSFVIPDLDNDMHDGTIAEGDRWLRDNLSAYADWAATHNSLLAVVWDEGSDDNRVPAVLYGAHIRSGENATYYTHYDLLSTVAGAFGLTGPRNAARASGFGSDLFD